MKKINITFFTGENTTFIERERNRWLDLFVEKYGAHNISRLYPTSQKELIQSELTTFPFLAEKRLVVLEDFMIKTMVDDWDEVPGTTCSQAEEWIGENIEHIPDTTVVLFIQSKPGVTNKLYKKLQQIATIRRFDELNSTDLRAYVKNKLPNIELSAISKLLAFKNNHLASIDSEIEKLALFKPKELITDDDIERYVVSDIETNVFRFLDTLLTLDQASALREFQLLLESNSVFLVFSWILSNLRRILYIQALFQVKYAPSEIVEILDIKSFWIEKHSRFKRNIVRLQIIFEKLVDVERSTKTGEAIWDWELGLELALHRILFAL